MTKVLNEYNRKHGLMKDSDPRLSGEDVREGLTAIISVKLTNCEFEGQTKGKLGNPEAKPLVEKLVMDCLTDYLEENPAVAKTIFEKSSTAQKAREAARKARELTRKKNNILDSSSLPGKLATAPTGMPPIPKSLSWKATPREVPPRTDGTGGSRLFFLCGARCSMWRRPVWSGCTATKS